MTNIENAVLETTKNLAWRKEAKGSCRALGCSVGDVSKLGIRKTDAQQACLISLGRKDEMNCPHCGLHIEPEAVKIKPERIELFFSKLVRTESGCWEWKGRTATPPRLPYGDFTLNGKSCTAHRWMWIFVHGFVPEGMDVLHRCDNARCVSPFHLFIGTHLENMRDKARKGRAHAMKGEAHPNSLHTNELVREVKRLKALGLSNREIEIQTGMNKNGVFRITSNTSWQHIKV